MGKPKLKLGNKKTKLQLDSSSTRQTEPSTIGKKQKHPTVEVVFSAPVFAKLQFLIAEMEKIKLEVGWWMNLNITKTKKHITLEITHLYIPEQEVLSVETDIPKIDSILPELNADGVPLNTLNAWFHLHPGGMSVSPSMQDEDQVKEHLQYCSTMLRGICNNRGDIKLDYYDLNDGLLYPNLNYTIDYGENLDTDKIKQQIKDRVKKQKCSYQHSAVTTLEDDEDFWADWQEDLWENYEPEKDKMMEPDTIWLNHDAGGTDWHRLYITQEQIDTFWNTEDLIATVCTKSESHENINLKHRLQEWINDPSSTAQSTATQILSALKPHGITVIELDLTSDLIQ